MKFFQSIFSMVIIALILACQSICFGQDNRSIIRHTSSLNHKSGKLGIYRALIIGIQNYDDPKIDDLKTPLNDAKAMAEILENRYGFKINRKTDLLLDKKATKKAIYNALRKITHTAKPEDSILIYYAGHGDIDRTLNDGWWIPVDAKGGDPFTYLDNTMVQKVMKNIKSKHVLLISDSCYSGTLFGRARAMPTVIDDKYYLNLYNEQSRWGMTSGNKTPVSDSGSRGHSVFAYQLIKKLEKNTRPYISTREIYTDIAPIIANNSDQSPLCNPIKGTGDMGGEFIFVAQGTTTITTPDVIVGSKGKLSIISDPEGADIFVGGKFKGRSPLDMDSIEPGDYRVKARLAGYDAIDKTVRVNSSRKAMVTFYFEKKETKGRLYVTTRPDGSIIKILNIKSGYVQGMELAAGQYTVRVSKTGYAPKTQTVRIAEGEGVDLYVELEKERVVSSEPGPGDTWTDPVTGMEFVWVPGGCFNMGQTQEEKQYLIKEVGKENYGKWYNDEVPRHEVCVDGFWMGKYEVTNGQYRRFKSGHDSKEYEGVNLNSSDQPLVMISWDYAKAFAKWLGREAGQSFVLPTEAQWEYAARGGTTTIRFWGDGPDQACRYANVHDVTSKKQFSNFTWLNHNCNDGFAAAAPVGSFLPNDFGLYDMLGNVWEWCEDVYDENAYSKHGRNNPVVISGGSSRVCRGGGWLGSPGGVRAAYRDGDSADSRLSGLGFRLCLPQVRQ